MLSRSLYPHQLIYKQLTYLPTYFEPMVSSVTVTGTCIGSLESPFVVL